MAPDPSRPNSSAPAFSAAQASASASTKAPPPGLTNTDLGAVALNRDMSQYIRTYAKDVARVTNQPAPAPVAKPEVTPEPQPIQSSDTKPKKNPVLQAVMKEKNFAGVVLPEMDSSPVNRPDGVVKEFPTETVDLKKEDSAGIFSRPTQPAPPIKQTPIVPQQPPAPIVPPAQPLPQTPPVSIQVPTPVPPPHPPPMPVPAPKPIQPVPAPQPVPKPVPPPVAPAPAPIVPPVQTTPKPVVAAALPIQTQKPIPQPAFTHTPTPAPATNVDDDREAVLARLRKKLADSRASSTPQAPLPPPPVPIVPPPASIPPPRQVVQTPPPVPLTRPEPVVESTWQPPAPPRPTPQPVPTPMPAPAAPLPTAPDALHTYSSDFAGRIDQEQASAFSVLAAQQDAGQGKVTSETTGRRSMLPIILAVLLIVLGAAGLFAAYRFINPASDGQQTLGVPSLIFADEKMEITGPDYRQSLANATNEPLVEGNILVTYVTTASSTALGLNEPQPGGVLIRQLNLGAPDILLRNVDLLSTVGIVRAGSQTRPFFILRVNSYERTFAGMLGWEQRMLASLDPLYPLYTDPAPVMPIESATTSPSTATTSASTQPLTGTPVANMPAAAFVDVVASNYDARALKDASGRTLIIYGYRDSQTLIIARDEAAFTALIARLAASSSL